MFMFMKIHTILLKKILVCAFPGFFGKRESVKKATGVCPWS